MKITTIKEPAEPGGITQRQCDILKVLASKKTITEIIMALGLADTVRSNVRWNAMRLVERQMATSELCNKVPRYTITERGIQAIKAYETGNAMEPVAYQCDTGIVRAPRRDFVAIPILPMMPYYRNNGNSHIPSLGAFA